MQGEEEEWPDHEKQSHRGIAAIIGTARCDSTASGLQLTCDAEMFRPVQNNNANVQSLTFPHLSLAGNLDPHFGSANIKKEPESRDYEPHYGLSSISVSKSEWARVFNPNRKYGLYVTDESGLYECHLCGRQFSKKRLYNFKRHMRNTHKDFSFSKVVRGKEARGLVTCNETNTWSTVGMESAAENVLEQSEEKESQGIVTCDTANKWSTEGIKSGAENMLEQSAEKETTDKAVKRGSPDPPQSELSDNSPSTSGDHENEGHNDQTGGILRSMLL